MTQDSNISAIHETMDSLMHTDLSWQDRIVTKPDVFQEADVCIVGAGVAGTALAWCLGRKGVSVALLERDYSEPDKFIGELLQPGGVQKLWDIGLGAALEGFDAQPVSGYALFNRGRSFNVSYPSVGGNVVTGRGFRYGKFVMSLRSEVAKLPNVTMIKGSATSLVESKTRKDVKGVKFKADGGNECMVQARLSVLCDGAFSRFRNDLTSSDNEIKGFMVGLLLKDAQLPFEGHGHVFLTNDSPCLVYPVSSNEIRVLIDFPGKKSPKTSGRLETRLEEVRQMFPPELRASYKQATEDIKVKAMPSQLLAARPSHGAGVVILGDALNMRHPLTGGGMTVALSDVQLLDSLMSKDDILEQSSLRNVIAAFYNLRHKSDASINILADALYDVMRFPGLKDACFDYLSRGPGYTEGPITILSAVSRDTNMLLRKFTDVAVYAARHNMKPFGLGSIRKSYNVLREAAEIVRPLIMNENPSLLVKTGVTMSYVLFPRRRQGSRSNS